MEVTDKDERKNIQPELKLHERWPGVVGGLVNYPDTVVGLTSRCLIKILQ